MSYILYAIGAIYLLGIIVFLHGIATAPVVDSKEPFLHDDYIPKEWKIKDGGVAQLDRATAF